MDAAAGIREIVTCAEQTQCAICTLSLDFWTAFEKLSHYYLCHIILNMVLTIARLKYCGPHTKMLPPELL
jgi:hypothetical protein